MSNPQIQRRYMSREIARARTKEIDNEQKKLEKISFPSQMLLFFGVIANLFSGKDVLPEILTSGALIHMLLVFAFVGIAWTSVKSWKLNRERNAILSKYGIW